MTLGHVAIGLTEATLREYTLVDPRSYSRSNASPFASKVQTGGQYSLLDTFSDWTVRDWRSGVGHESPDDGPLFSVADTRFGGQLMLPPGMKIVDAPADTSAAINRWPSYTGHEYDSVGGNLEAIVGSSTSHEYAGLMYSVDTTLSGVWVYIAAPYGTVVTAKLYANSSNRPTGAALATATATSKQRRPHAHWMYIALTKTGLTTGTQYHVSVSYNYVNNTSAYVAQCRLPAVKASFRGSYRVGAGAWAAATSSSWEAAPRIMAVWGTHPGVRRMIAAGGRLYLQNSLGTFQWEGEGFNVTQLTNSNFTSSLSSSGNYVWMAGTTGTNFAFTEIGVSTTTIGYEARMFATGCGYIWRAGDTEIWYSSVADGLTWTGPFEVATLGNRIRGMAALGNSMYISCDDGLYWLAPGDQVVPVVQWPQSSSSNGVGMCQWEGALYIPLYNSIVRFSADGSLLAIGPQQAAGLPQEIAGPIHYLYPTPHFLFVCMGNPDADGYSSLWAYNVDGWHCLSLGPQGVAMRTVAINPADNNLYWGGDSGIMLRTYYPPNTTNPMLATSGMMWEQEGWVEYDRHIGGYSNLNKDVESFYVDRQGDGVSAASPRRRGYSDVYVQAPSLATEGWYAVKNTPDVVYTVPDAVRPYGKWVRVGLLLRALNRSETPVVRGLSMRYSTMLTDRWRWMLHVGVSDRQEMIDGTINPHNLSAQESHLESLIASVTPVYLRDVDGTVYRCKITGVSVSVSDYDVLLSSVIAPKYVYQLILEQL